MKLKNVKLFVIMYIGFLFIICPNLVNASHVDLALNCEDFVDGPDGTKIKQCHFDVTVSEDPNYRNKVTIKFLFNLLHRQKIGILPKMPTLIYLKQLKHRFLLELKLLLM